MISTLTYLSTLDVGLSRSDLEGLVESSRVRNERVGITGLLLVHDRRVMQILEGAAPEVDRLYARIRRDARHRDVTQVWDSSARQRRFPDWSMGFEDLAEPIEADSLPKVAAPTADLRAALTPDQRTFLNRRLALLRRGLASGNRLISALAVIMDSHDPETRLSPDGQVALRCRQCRADGPNSGYPCPTAQNAFWALDSTF